MGLEPTTLGFQHSSDQRKILKEQSAQTTARVASIAYHLWLPFLIDRALNLTKLRSVIYDQSVDSSRFALWELISTAQIKGRSWRTRVLKLLLELRALQLKYIYIYMFLKWIYFSSYTWYVFHLCKLPATPVNLCLVLLT